MECLASCADGGVGAFYLREFGKVTNRGWRLLAGPPLAPQLILVPDRSGPIGPKIFLFDDTPVVMYLSRSAVGAVLCRARSAPLEAAASASAKTVGEKIVYTEKKVLLYQQSHLLK